MQKQYYAGLKIIGTLSGPPTITIAITIAITITMTIIVTTTTTTTTAAATATTTITYYQYVLLLLLLLLLGPSAVVGDEGSVEEANLDQYPMEASGNQKGGTYIAYTYVDKCINNM